MLRHQNMEAPLQCARLFTKISGAGLVFWLSILAGVVEGISDLKEQTQSPLLPRYVGLLFEGEQYKGLRGMIPL